MGAPYLLGLNNTAFPPADHALMQPNGLLAVGGDLKPTRLLAAYRAGIFPWFNSGSPILWWSPNPRMILWPEQFKLSRSLKKIIAKDTFHVTHNQAFAALIHLCAEIHGSQDNTWITTDMQKAYLHMHQLGYAHSIEVWQADTLVGGLYGILIDRVFCGESMVSTVSNTSKIALAYLAQHAAELGIAFIDCQLPSAHLASLGGQTLTRNDFLSLLQQHLFKQAS